MDIDSVLHQLEEGISIDIASGCICRAICAVASNTEYGSVF